MYALSNYLSQTVTVSALDGGNGQTVVTAGKKARMILCVNAYDGTNTAAANFDYGVVAVNTENNIGTTFPITAGGNPFFNYTKSNSAHGGFTVVDPDFVFPQCAKSNGTALAVIPPQHAFGIVNRATNMDGTVIVNIITAEIGE